MPGFQIPGDLTLNEDATDMALATGINAIAQSVRTGALVFRGYWRYELNAGIPYLDAAFDKGADLGIIRTVFWRFLLDTPGIVAVESLTLTFDEESRILYVDFTARTTTGEILSDSLPFPILS